jgi:acetyl-CoA carboxylase biotin carboxyl carrier protein
MKFEHIKEIINIFDKSKLSKITLKNDEIELSLEKNNEVVQQVQTITQPVKQPQSTPEPVVEVKKESNLSLTLNAPMVGTFYIAPSPTAKSFVNVGDIVRKGQTVAIIEAMKIMNEWEAEFDCKILKLLVDDGQAVEYGTPIFEVEKING